MPITARCHCGDIALTIEGEIPPKLTRCTCSLCARRGGLYAYYKPEQFHVTAVPASDSIYRWNTMQVAHHFCGRCGCLAYMDSPDYQRDGSWDGKTRRIGVNARLFDGFDAAEAPVEVIDGRNLW
jgi:hypothetical protein